MQNELMYSFRENNVRVVMKDNEPWFVMKDICEVLDIKNARDAFSRLEEHEKGVGSTDSYNSPMNIINEYGLYSLIFTSRKPEAREFKNWVTKDILPSIRKTGRYEVATDSYMIDDPVKRAERWIEEQKEKRLLLETVELQKPKVALAESIENSDSLILVRDLAVILKQNGYEIGQNRLFERLRDLGYLVKGGSSRNMPTQRSMDLGLFRIVESTYTDSKGPKINKVPKVTGKGQSYFVNKFLKG